MIRKPLSIIILSILFLISPIAILVMNAALNMIPLVGFNSIIFRLRILDILILCLYIATGISIFFVKKWGWWVIISSALLMFIYNIFTYFKNPFSSIIVLLLMNLTLFLVTLIFFRKHLIAPYFNPKLRWWEQDQRYEIDIYLRFLGINKNVIISDISEGGCYIYVDYLIESGTELPVLIVCGSFHITLQAKIMRIAKETDRYYGYGLMFSRIDNIEKTGLRNLINKLKLFSYMDTDDEENDEKRGNHRYFIGYDISLIAKEESSPANIEDISKGGCSLFSSIVMEINDKCYFNFRIDRKNYELRSKVIWKKGEEGNRHYGLKYLNIDRESKEALNKMIKYSTKLGAKQRSYRWENFDQLCEEKLPKTPYLIILWLRRLLNKKNI